MSDPFTRRIECLSELQKQLEEELPKVARNEGALVTHSPISS